MIERARKRKTSEILRGFQTNEMRDAYILYNRRMVYTLMDTQKSHIVRIKADDQTDYTTDFVILPLTVFPHVKNIHYINIII